MRIAVLTTDTAHHRYFLWRQARELPDQCELVLNIFETKEYPWARMKKRHVKKSLPKFVARIRAYPYAASPELGAAQTAYEETAFFPDGDRSLPDGLPSQEYYSVNDKDCLATITAS